MAGKRSFGSLRKLPSGRWQARYTGPDLRTYNAPETFTAKIDAEAWLAAERKLTEDPESWRSPSERLAGLRAKLEAERLRTFAVYAEDWLEHRNLAPSTRYKYRRLMDQHLLPAFGDKPLTAITRADVTAWHRRTLVGKPTARKHVYDLLAVIMRTAEDDELIPRTPVRVRGASRIERAGSTEPATPDELGIILQHTPTRFRLMVLLSVWCALRPAEVRALRRGDVDAKNGVLKIRRAWDRTPGAAETKAPKTRAGVRDVRMPSELIPAVAEHLLEHTQPGRDGLLFPSARGRMVSDAVVAEWYYPARMAAGRPDLRLHDLRHTGLTWAGRTGATNAELMARAGHKTLAASIRYQHASAERDRAIADRMGEMFPVPKVRSD